jgi:predicted MPP superfamily phosphohydrolase
MKILAVSDLHLRSNHPKATENDASTKAQYGWRRSPVLLKILEKTIVPTYNHFFEANLRARTSIDDFLNCQDLVVSKINEETPDIVIVVGDTFDVSGKVGRDNKIHDDVFKLISDFIERVDAPVIFLPGNSDVIALGKLEEVLDKLSELDTIEHLGDKIDDFSLSYKSRGNFVIETGCCTIVGLNSVSQAEYKQDEKENKDIIFDIIASNQNTPLIVFTHHPPFKVLSFVSRKILKTGIPAQEWIIKGLQSYSENTRQRSMVVSGHCHKSVDRYEGNVREICLLPMLTRRQEGIHIGSLVNIQHGEINISKVFV